MSSKVWLVSWLHFTSLRQRGHFENAPPFTVPCVGREAQNFETRMYGW